jgi:phthalate 4,5-cis-dihydrodiol dehydrogenase
MKAGMVGLGAGAVGILRRLDLCPFAEVYAGADIDPQVRETAHAVYPEMKLYETAEELAADPDVDAIWVMTANRLHAEHTIIAANAGKHVAVTKPMCITVEEAEAMVEAAERNHVNVIAGNSHSYSTPIRLIAQIARSGALGKVKAVNLFAINDWMLRNRRPEDFDLTHGGGILYRGAPHQVDVARLIAGGKLRSVRGTYGDWEPARPAPGYYSAYMEFEDGTACVMYQNAYGYFDFEEMSPWAVGVSPGKGAGKRAEVRNRIRKEAREGTRNELDDYLSRGIAIARSPDGGRDPDASTRATVASGGKSAPEFGSDMGFVFVSCERGDIRQAPAGAYVYDDDGVVEYKLKRGNLYDEEIDEVYGAAVLGQKPLHDERWGLSTMEATLAILESGKTHREVELTRQSESSLDPEYAAAHIVEPESITRLS